MINGVFASLFFMGIGVLLFLGVSTLLWWMFCFAFSVTIPLAKWWVGHLLVIILLIVIRSYLKQDPPKIKQ